jgi:hypothetical protein
MEGLDDPLNPFYLLLSFPLLLFSSSSPAGEEGRREDEKK